MSLLPPVIQDGLAARLGGPLRAAPLTGGDVNRVALVTCGSERLVVKWKPNAPPGLFGAEADGLSRLRNANAIRVPEVIAYDDTADPPWLAMEYIPPRYPEDAQRFARSFAEALAALHRDNPAPDGKFGLERDNYLGSQPQRNTPTARWADFYRDTRLLPQIERAGRLGLLPLARAAALRRVTDNLELLLCDFPAAPVLIHGDLWSGNFLSAGNDPVLIDPAVHYAEREVEVAFTELFGGFPPGFHTAYHETLPLDIGYARRRPLHQLYPLLIHLNHFGESYGPAVDHACRQTMGARR